MMVDKKNSMRGPPQEGGRTDRKTKSRTKNRGPGPPPGSERAPKPVENIVDNDVSTTVTTDSSSLREEPEEIEAPGRLSKSQILAVQNDYRSGFTIDQIKLLTGNSRA